MRVNELAQSLGVTADTVRYYTRIGFLSPTKNPDNGYKEYGEKEVRRLRFIISARQLGFQVEDIEKILSEADNGKSPCPVTREIIIRRLAETENQFNNVVHLRRRMLAATKEWESKPDKDPDGHMICHLIEEFTEIS